MRDRYGVRRRTKTTESPRTRVRRAVARVVMVDVRRSRYGLSVSRRVLECGSRYVTDVTLAGIKVAGLVPYAIDDLLIFTVNTVPVHRDAEDVGVTGGGVLGHAAGGGSARIEVNVVRGGVAAAGVCKGGKKERAMKERGGSGGEEAR